MKHFPLWLLLLVILFVSVTPTAAVQDTCPTIVENAVSAAQSRCATMQRNQVCYGNVNLQADPQPNAANFTLSQPGDMANLVDVKSLRLSSMNVAQDEWGLALLRVQANLPEALPGQNVIFVLFGDVQMTDAGGNTAQAAAGAASGAAVETATPEADSSASATPEVPAYGPMQAFYFTSGISDSRCSTAPDSGILVQTPAGAAQVNLLVNEVAVSLGSTVYFQADPGTSMTTSVVEGQATLTAFGTTIVVPAGGRSEIPLDANGAASGPPGAVEAYDPARLAALPLPLLDIPVTIAPPLTADQIAALAASAAGASASTVAASYQAEKVMNLGGETISGDVCSVNQAFVITLDAGVFSFPITFTPESGSQGAYAYSYALGGVGETHNASGTYTISDAAADGSRRLVMDGSDCVKFNGFDQCINMHYEIGLTPAAPGTCGG